jgi:hypothetical protein
MLLMAFIAQFFAMDKLDQVRLILWTDINTKKLKKDSSYHKLMKRVQTQDKILDWFKEVLNNLWSQCSLSEIIKI